MKGYESTLTLFVVDKNFEKAETNIGNYYSQKSDSHLDPMKPIFDLNHVQKYIRKTKSMFMKFLKNIKTLNSLN